MESGTLADWLEHSFGWMAWTWVTGTFFLTILGLLAAAGTLTLIPGAVVIWFVRNYIAKGFALGRV